ncbi:MAG: Flp pilus assembly protein CpaB, partial [Elusimicrobiota bacterium]|nr:Flp pilus assembly protein CpaB [Elusimicrobiota bacterium]
MVKFKLKKEWILPLAFAAAAGMAALIYFSALKTQYKSMADPIKVVAAKERIAVGQTIKASQLQEISIPRQYAQPKVFTSMEKLFGANNKTVYVALSPIEKGEQILATKISKPSDLTGIANIIPEGLRAFPVNFDDKNLQILMPGSYIDVLGVFGYTDKNKLYHEIVYVIAQNILVLSVGDEFLGFAGKTDMENLPNRANV